MSFARGSILRALLTVVFVGGIAAALGASGTGEAGRATAAPVVLSDNASPALLRRLTPRGETTSAGGADRSGPPSAGSALAALAFVVLVILGAARLWKTHGPKSPTAAPRDAIEVLGRCRIEARQSVYLVRLGSRILVLGSSGGELSTLSEVTDPVEVDLIAARCREGGGMASPFSRLFDARRKADESADATAEAPPAPLAEPRSKPWFRSVAEQRLAERVHGRSGDGETRRAS